MAIGDTHVPRSLVRVALVAALGLLVWGPPSADAAAGPRQVIVIQMVNIGAPGNPAAAIVPFQDAIYPTCAQSGAANCLSVGAVARRYRIGRLEVTVRQWVKFLNTADPAGRNRHRLYSASESSASWPKYGQINFRAKARRGRHYSVAFAQWADKPYGFANFLRAARFANSVENGQILSRGTVTEGRVRVTRYRIRLSPTTERGMYDLRDTRNGPTRARARGFVIPSQDEWIKAAYFDPAGGGQYSYWKYPTNPGTFGSGSTDAPSSTVLDGATGDVTAATSVPRATFHADGVPAPSWCPGQITPQSTCTVVNPFGINPVAYPMLYQGSLGTVGQAATPSPWGTLDQGGNAVEWTDTIAPAPGGAPGVRTWRRLHGGVPNAPAYQLWLSAVGLQPQNNLLFTRTYPWLGFRIGAIGDPRPRR